MDGLFSISGKVALVTGGSRGVGYMIARGLLDAGARVYISSANAEACERAAAELSAWGECQSVPAELSKQAECARLAQELGRREKSLHLLVNNAGVTVGAPLDSFTDELWDRVLDINLKAVFHLTRFARSMLDAGAAPGSPACVINIGSVDGLHVPSVENYSYTASKAALHHLTRHLAKRLAPRIAVNALALGPFESDMMDAALGREMAARAPAKRMGVADDVVGSVIFLGSRAGAFVTGAVIPLDGGLITTL